jgi:hypothetical protein
VHRLLVQQGVMLRRRTIIVYGPLALHMRRQLAADRVELGLALSSLPLLASRLAGGFIRPVTSDDLEPAIRLALEQGGFAELGGLERLPGAARAAAKTLRSIWDADLNLAGSSTPRVRDLTLLEARIRRSLPSGAMLPRALRDLALERVHHAPGTIGDVELERVPVVAPIWRPLLAALCNVVSVRWFSPDAEDLKWFPGEIVHLIPPETAPTARVVTCSNPRSEVIEALRWARQLISSGKATPEEIAITAASTSDWDDHIFTLAKGGELPLHMSNGVPALSTEDGQACAALADLLLNGLSQQRVRRLLTFAAGQSEGLRQLRSDWAAGVSVNAGLFELAHWRTALERAQARRSDGVDVLGVVMPALELLSRGVCVAVEAGTQFLRLTAQLLWSRALRAAPAEALMLSLQDLRVTHSADAANSIAWCPASHLVGAPRRWVWLMGMSSGAWPRKRREDPLLPDHLFPRDSLEWDAAAMRQRRNFSAICAQAFGGSYISRSRSNAAGGRLPASPLLISLPKPINLLRARIPRHAFSEADRLLARPRDAIANPRTQSALNAFADWQSIQITAHDGQFNGKHPVVDRALTQPQSATSLRRLLRDPISFVWRYALGWHPTTMQSQPLELDPRSYGELVHELLRRTVDHLELGPGMSQASHEEIRLALADAVAQVLEEWPLARPVPPGLLWPHTLRHSEALALRALTSGAACEAGTRSWTEVPFGSDEEVAGDWPWSPTAKVIIPGTSVSIRGKIDRLDWNGAAGSVWVTDYKTGTRPARADRLIVGGGSELQRIVYALAPKQLLPRAEKVVARLFYLIEEAPLARELSDIDRAIADVSGYVAEACALLTAGKALPGLQPDEHDEYRFAMPATLESYLKKVKDRALRRAFGRFTRIWGAA